jgi:tetratricopeptide (TPR) repeat protein
MYQECLAQAVHHLGSSYLCAGRGAEAEKQFERALALREPLLKLSFPGHDEMLKGLAETAVNLGLLCSGSQRTERALTLFRRAEGILQPVVQAHPEDTGALLTWACLQANWGTLVADPKSPSDALARYEEAIRRTEEILRLEPRHASARNTAYNAHGSRAVLFNRLEQNVEAIREWDRMLELGDTPDKRHYVRYARIVSLTLLGCHGRAALEARALAADAATPTYQQFVLAQCLAVSMGAAVEDPKLPSWERPRLFQEYGDEAMRLLRRLHDQRKLEPQWLKTLKEDEGFAALRARRDCHRLIRAAEGGK